MTPKINSPVVYLRFIHAMSLLVPVQARLDWRREWEAEINARWQTLQKRNQVNFKNKLDLLNRVAGAPTDVVSYENNKSRLFLGALNILVAVIMGFAAVKEFAFTVILKGHLQPLVLSSAAIIVCVLFIISAIAMLREWTAVRALVLVTGVLSLVVHVYGALPPHRNMGYVALLLGGGYAIVMMFVYQRAFSRSI
jgi:hypothetical protein